MYPPKDLHSFRADRLCIYDAYDAYDAREKKEKATLPLTPAASVPAVAAALLLPVPRPPAPVRPLDLFPTVPCLSFSLRLSFSVSPSLFLFHSLFFPAPSLPAPVFGWAHVSPRLPTQTFLTAPSPGFNFSKLILPSSGVREWGS